MLRFFNAIICSSIIPLVINLGSASIPGLFAPRALHKTSEIPEQNVLIETNFELVLTKVSPSSQERCP